MIDIIDIKGKKIVFIDELSFGYPLDMGLNPNDKKIINEAGKTGYSAGYALREILLV